MNKKASIGLFGLTMLMTGAVDGISNLPSIAMFGQQLVFFFVVAICLFLLPVSLISAELCAQFKEDSGVYVWTNQAFGGSFSALVIWLQWINTMVWFPTCLTTLVGTAAYLIDPKLIHDPVYLVCTSLTAFWIMTLINLKGVKQSTRFASFGTSIGMIIPMLLVIGLSILWVIMGKPLAIKLTHQAIMPHLGSISTWTSLTAILTSFLGMELAAVHVKKVKNAEKVFPKALLFSVLIIIFTMGLGSLGVALVVPHQQIVLVSGTIQAFHTLFVGFHVPWLADVIGAMLLLGSLGAMINWLISPANGLAQAAKKNYLPKMLATENSHGVPSKILLLQGAVITAVSSAFFLMPSINGSYWLLLDLSTELYLLMYVLMFISALKLIFSFKKTLLIPGGKPVAILISSLGLIGCVIALVVGFFPPHNIDVGSHLHYTVLFGAGIAVMCSPALLLIWYKNRSHNFRPLSLQPDRG